MSTSMDECRLRVCTACGETAVDPMTDTCYECGFTETTTERASDWEARDNG